MKRGWGDGPKIATLVAVLGFAGAAISFSDNVLEFFRSLRPVKDEREGCAAPSPAQVDRLLDSFEAGRISSDQLVVLFQGVGCQAYKTVVSEHPADTERANATADRLELALREMLADRKMDQQQRREAAQNVSSVVNALDQPGAKIEEQLDGGISIQWTSPMGPIRYEISKVLTSEEYDRTESFKFSTETQF